MYRHGLGQAHGAILPRRQGGNRGSRSDHQGFPSEVPSWLSSATKQTPDNDFDRRDAPLVFLVVRPIIRHMVVGDGGAQAGLLNMELHPCRAVEVAFPAPGGEDHVIHTREALRAGSD